jgi:hypothetical protein
LICGSSGHPMLDKVLSFRHRLSIQVFGTCVN